MALERGQGHARLFKLNSILRYEQIYHPYLIPIIAQRKIKERTGVPRLE